MLLSNLLLQTTYVNLLLIVYTNKKRNYTITIEDIQGLKEVNLDNKSLAILDSNLALLPLIQLDKSRKLRESTTDKNKKDYRVLSNIFKRLLDRYTYIDKQYNNRKQGSIVSYYVQIHSIYYQILSTYLEEYRSYIKASTATINNMLASLIQKIIKHYKTTNYSTKKVASIL